MEPTIKAAWVDLMRNGDYPQGRYRLLQKGRYCPLGILCDYSKMGYWIRAFSAEDSRPDLWQYAEDDCEDLWLYKACSVPASDYLPPTVKEWARVSDEGERKISKLNDDGVSLDRIAHWVEVFL